MTRWDGFSEREKELIEQALRWYADTWPTRLQPEAEDIKTLAEELHSVRLNSIASYGLGGRA